MLNKSLTISDLSNDFLKAVIPYERGPNKEKILKRHGDADMNLDDAALLEKNPIGIMQASTVVIERIELLAAQNGIELDQAFVLLTKELAQQIKVWPKVETFEELTSFLECRRDIKHALSRQAAHAMTNALNNFGPNFIL